MATKPTETTDGIELPTGPGVWVRDGEFYLAHYTTGPVCLRLSKVADGGLVTTRADQSPRGGWFPATPAPEPASPADIAAQRQSAYDTELKHGNDGTRHTIPAPAVEGAAKEIADRFGAPYRDTLDILRQHSSSTEGELARAVESACGKLVEAIDTNPVHSRCGHDESACIICSTWARLWQALKDFRQHADQAAPASPAATARTFEDWRNDEADDATAAPVGQGDAATTQEEGQNRKDDLELHRALCALHLEAPQLVVNEISKMVWSRIKQLSEQLAAAERKNDGMQLQLNSMEKLVAESSPGRIASLKDRCRCLENALNDSPGHEPVAMSAFQRCFNVRNYFEQRALAAEAELAELKRQVAAKGEPNGT